MTTNLTFDEQYNILNGRIFNAVARLLNQNFKTNGIDITREQWTVLAVLWRNNGISQQIIADETGRDKPSTTRLLDNLEKLDYIERRSHANDRRTNLIYLTEKGKREKGNIMTVVENTITAITNGLTNQQMQDLRFVFKKVYSNIES